MDDGSEARLTGLEEELRAIAARLDPVPADLLRAAQGAFTWRRADAELAELVFDSLTEDLLLEGQAGAAGEEGLAEGRTESLALVRGEAPRLLTFRATDLIIEVELTPVGGAGAAAAGGCSLLGQLQLARMAQLEAPARVEVRQPDGVLEVTVDELGRFAADRLPAGPVSLCCWGVAPRPVVTTWVMV